MANTLGLPDGLLEKLSAADKASGLEAGTMASILQQEVGGKANEYLKDPTKYHYDLNKNGKRIAGHTGKESSATGPFGILRSTGEKPGYGVDPIKDWTNLDEHIRFAADYAKARGIAAYGEGAKYEKQVRDRMASSTAVSVPPVLPPQVMAMAPSVGAAAPAMDIPVEASSGVPMEALVSAPVMEDAAPVMPTGNLKNHPWLAFASNPFSKGSAVPDAPSQGNFFKPVDWSSFAPAIKVNKFAGFGAWGKKKNV